jgi:aryl-alcohol dehydrogenase-like predicted oxidoreductase
MGAAATALGLGTCLTFDLEPGARRGGLRQVFERCVGAGGRVVDTSPLYGSAEVSVASS